MKRLWLKYVLAPQPGENTDTASAGTQTQEPAAGETKPAEPQGQPAQNPAAQANQEPKQQTGQAAAEPKQTDKTTLLGEAVDAGKQPKAGADGDAKTKPDGGQTGDGKTQDPYGELSLPEGTAIDEVQMGNFKKLAQEIGLEPKHAQRMLDFEAERLTAQAKQAREEWKQQTFEKYGAKITTVMSDVARAVEKFGGDELRQLFDQTGLGNHPLVVEAFSRAGAMLKEDKSVPSNAAAGDKTFEEALYGGRSK